MHISYTCHNFDLLFILFYWPLQFAFYQKHASRELIDILNTLGFSDEIQGGTKMISFYIRDGEW